jgi:hypothetical protein
LSFGHGCLDGTRFARSVSLAMLAAIRRALSRRHNENLSISVGSSSGARALLTRFEAGHFCGDAVLWSQPRVFVL